MISTVCQGFKNLTKALFFTTAFAFANSVTAISNAQDIVIHIRDDVYEDYQKFVNERDVLSINNFTGAAIRRDVVDMIIAQQALRLGGFNYTFSYVPGKVNFRNTKMLESGNLLISFDSYWLADASTMSDHLYISAPVIRNGEYVAGIYTNPDNKGVLAITELKDLSEFTAISTPKWRTDWHTLSELPLKKLLREDEWLSMARMIHIGWVDFMLMPFNSTPDQSFTLDQIRLVPVPNIGIELKDSRHFVISKKHPLGEEAIVAINKGLAILRERNAIVSAYTQAKFFIDHNIVKVIN